MVGFGRQHMHGRERGGGVVEGSLTQWATIPCGVTVLSQCCYSVVTVLLQCCYCVVTVLLLRRRNDIAIVTQRCCVRDSCVAVVL
jgi:hypothetical protein